MASKRIEREKERESYHAHPLQHGEEPSICFHTHWLAFIYMCVYMYIYIIKYYTIYHIIFIKIYISYICYSKKQLHGKNSC